MSDRFEFLTTSLAVLTYKLPIKLTTISRLLYKKISYKSIEKLVAIIYKKEMFIFCSVEKNENSHTLNKLTRLQAI